MQPMKFVLNDSLIVGVLFWSSIHATSKIGDTSWPLEVRLLTICIPMHSSFWFDTITWDSPFYIYRGDRLYIKKRL